MTDLLSQNTQQDGTSQTESDSVILSSIAEPSLIVAPEPVVSQPIQQPVQAQVSSIPSPQEPAPEPILGAPSMQSVAQKPPVETPPPPPIPSIPVSSPPDLTQGSGAKKRGSSAMILAVLLLLLIALPVGVYYISQNQSLNDIRNRAVSTYPDKQCTIENGVDSCPSGQRCHCQDGNACTKTACETDDQTYTSCKLQNRSWCVNQGGEAHTCCAQGYTCGTSNGCYRTGGGGGDDDTPTPTQPGSSNTPTHTPSQTPTGSVTLTPTATGFITNTPTHTPTATPTSQVSCNEACTVNTDCSSGLVCADSHCRNSQCTESSTCQCGSVTNTPTPTPVVFVGCNSACTVNTDCNSGLVCVDSSCRNPSCTEKTSCQCDSVQPTPQTPVAGTGPSVLGASVIAGGFLLLLLGLAL